jgi:hypothetical protein
MSKVIEGVVAFSNLTECDSYKGKSTGRYTLTLVLSEADAAKLGSLGVHVKEYKDKKQRKFASKYPVRRVVTADDQPFTGEIPYGSRVRVAYETGEEHPEHGVPTYVNAVRVLELSDNGSSGLPEEF